MLPETRWLCRSEWSCPRNRCRARCEQGDRHVDSREITSMRARSKPSRGLLPLVKALGGREFCVNIRFSSVHNREGQEGFRLGGSIERCAPAGSMP